MVWVRVDVIVHARAKYVGKHQPCMVPTLRIVLWPTPDPLLDNIIAEAPAFFTAIAE